MFPFCFAEAYVFKARPDNAVAYLWVLYFKYIWPDEKKNTFQNIESLIKGWTLIYLLILLIAAFIFS